MENYSRYFREVDNMERAEAVEEINNAYREAIFYQMNPNNPRLQQRWRSTELPKYGHIIENSIMTQKVVSQLSTYLQNLSLQKPNLKSIELHHLAWNEEKPRLISKSLQFDKGTSKKLPWKGVGSYTANNKIQIEYSVQAKKNRTRQAEIVEIKFIYSADDDIFWCIVPYARARNYRHISFRCDDTLGFIKFIEWFTESL